MTNIIWGVGAIVGGLGLGALIVGSLVFEMFGSTCGDMHEKVQISRLQSMVMVFSARNGRAPTTAEGLAAALAPDDVPLDQWGNPFQYVTPGPDGRAYNIFSFGADGMAGGVGAAADIYLAEPSGRSHSPTSTLSPSSTL